MDFKDQIKLLSERVIKLKNNIATEEATKTALIMPFIQALGYDIFDPTEVWVSTLRTSDWVKLDFSISPSPVN